MKRKSRTKIVKRVNAFLIALVLILTSIQVPAQGALREDYGSITVSDIILAWYNASGVAIGNTNIANAIISLYDDITLNDLIDEGIIVSTIPNSSTDDIKEMLGYGNMSVPVLNINKGKLRAFLGDIPANNVAYEALTAMFNFGTTDIMEGVFAGLASVIGQVANIGKIGYNVVRDVVEDIGSNPLWTSVKDAYNHFVDTTYFQDLLSQGSGDTEGEWTIVDANGNVKDNYGIVLYATPTGNYTYLGPFIGQDNNQFGIMTVNPSLTTTGVRTGLCDINLPVTSSETWTGHEGDVLSIDKDNKKIIVGTRNGTYNATGWFYARSVSSYVAGRTYIPVGKMIVISDVSNMTNAQIRQYAIDNNPWGSSSGGGGGTGDGVTDYINNAVGNITEQNYSILSPNINVGQYMYLADGASYIENLNNITNNTNNGNYTENGNIITNYNNTYIQNTTQETRPTVGPVESPIPAQPFISPRPTQPPESYEAVIHQGGIPETIKQKFPFCIPWDLAAVLQNLWAPEARAPYIHWDATFGSWGKLGEVDLDFSIFNDAARIFRATTLILWIIGLVVITRNIIGG